MILMTNITPPEIRAPSAAPRAQKRAFFVIISNSMFLDVIAKMRDTRTEGGSWAGDGGDRGGSGVETEECCAALVGRRKAFEGIPAAWGSGFFEVVKGGGGDGTSIGGGGRDPDWGGGRRHLLTKEGV
jgi:hypothetical protein